MILNEKIHEQFHPHDSRLAKTDTFIYFTHF